MSELTEAQERALKTWGLDADTESSPWSESAGLPGRVVITHGPVADVLTVDEDGDVRTISCRIKELDGRTPVAGDWARIHGDSFVELAPRRTELARPRPSGNGVQVLAANIDVVLVVLPIDRGFNAKAAERLTVMAWDSGATPVLVLTKTDLCDDVDGMVEEAMQSVPGVDIVLTSSVTGHGLTDLFAHMVGRTSTMLGASGVGKTSLLNALEGRTEAVQSVGKDAQGRHTTTTRCLYPLSGGGVLLDLPGIRALDLLAGDLGVDATYSEIAEYAQDCRFADCGHGTEPGCAVREAIDNGDIDQERFERWEAINREMAYVERKNDPALMAAQKREWKQVTKQSRKNRVR